MAAFKIIYNTVTNSTGTFLQTTPLPPAAFRLSGPGGFTQIEIANAAGSDITIEAIPLTCSAFDKPGKLMHFKIKDGQSKTFDLRKDLAGAFRTSTEAIPILWKASSKNGHADPIGVTLTTRDRTKCQIAIGK